MKKIIFCLKNICFTLFFINKSLKIKIFWKPVNEKPVLR